MGAMDAIHALVDANGSSSAALTDAKLRTFLHVAVENKQREVVKFICRQPWPAFEDIIRSLFTCGQQRTPCREIVLSMMYYIVEFFGGEPRARFNNNILNMKDYNGNTALHLAVQNRDESSFRYLVGNRYVDLNEVNNEGFTPLDLASKLKMQYTFASLQNPTEWMIRVLAYSGAYFTARRRDLKFGMAPRRNQEPSAPAPAPTTDSVLVASALIATVTFAAAFTVPGSYKTGGSPNAGTPELGSHYGFKVFLVADILACYCSVAATFSLAAYGTQAHVDPLVRRRYAKRALWLFHVALKNVIVAFALGITIVMWDISIATTIIVAVAATAFILYGNEALAHDLRLMMVMRRRLGFKWSWNLNPSTSSHLDWNTRRLRSFSATFVMDIFTLCWAYVLIFGLAFFAQKVLNKQ
ncbi:hypothetical protein BS78_07G027600 [Paspalum vaginatum]|nr:hypothetical protein BS78_07G027600 [Paspalum vaginatum]